LLNKKKKQILREQMLDDLEELANQEDDEDFDEQDDNINEV